jgi:hypothetical protein
VLSWSIARLDSTCSACFAPALVQAACTKLSYRSVVRLDGAIPNLLNFDPTHALQRTPALLLRHSLDVILVEISFIDLLGFDCILLAQLCGGRGALGRMLQIHS